VGSVLEVGCAFGRFSAYLSRSRAYVGIDLSLAAVQKARADFPHRVFLWGDALALGEGWHRAFDTLVAMQFLEHFEDPAAVLRRLRALARKRVVLTVPKGLPHSEAQDGHVSGWETWESFAEMLASACSAAEVVRLNAASNHFGAALTWR